MELRKIKIRVWDKEEKKMIYPNENGFIEANGIEYCMSFDGRIYENNGNEDTTDRFIKLQYIGLKDENSKETYEGDIIEVKFSDNGALPVEAREQVFTRRMGVYRNLDFLGFYFQFTFPNGETLNHSPLDAINKKCFREIKVIGSIFKNKDLLK